MSVTVDTVIQHSVVATTDSWTHTLAANATAILISVSRRADDVGPVSVTVGGINAVKLVELIDAGSTTQTVIWGLGGPPTGAQTVVVTATGGGADAMDSASISFIGSKTTFGNVASNNAASLATSLSATISGFASDSIAYSQIVADELVSLTSGQNQQFNTADAENRFLYGGSTGNIGVSTLSWTFTALSTRGATMAVVEILNATAVTQVPYQPNYLRLPILAQ